MQQRPECQDCRYWDKINDTNGYCRFNPPVYSSVYEPYSWPITHAVDWCGKFEEVPVDQSF